MLIALLLAAIAVLVASTLLALLVAVIAWTVRILLRVLFVAVYASRWAVRRRRMVTHVPSVLASPPAPVQLARRPQQCPGAANTPQHLPHTR